VNNRNIASFGGSDDLGAVAVGEQAVEQGSAELGLPGLADSIGSPGGGDAVLVVEGAGDGFRSAMATV
jgi:hypothetical protein